MSVKWMRHESKITFILMSFLIVSKGKIIDYCKLVEEGEPHSACNNTCFPKANNTIINPTFQYRVDMLEGHNFYRNYFAGGGNTSGGNSQASNMLALSYDMGLEFTVACWMYNHGLMEHDANRGTPRFIEAGQNLWEGNIISADPRTREGVMHVLWKWYRELQWMRAEWIDSYPKSAERDKVWNAEGVGPFKVGHFTQLVWAETSHVGCALCFREDKAKFLVGCNYGPAGNFIGDPVYKRGPPTSACPEGTKANKDYPNLCGEIEPWSKDNHYEGIPEMEERWDTLYKNHPDYPKYRKVPPIPEFIKTTSTRIVRATRKIKFRRSMATKPRITNELLMSLCLSLFLPQHNSLAAEI